MAKTNMEKTNEYNFESLRIQEPSKPEMVGLWMLLHTHLVYEESKKNCLPDTDSLVKLFHHDPIGYELLARIIKKNANAENILLHQLYAGNHHLQDKADIAKVISEATNPELVAYRGSDFVAVIADADYGMDVWIWDLCCCKLP